MTYYDLKHDNQLWRKRIAHWFLAGCVLFIAVIIFASAGWFVSSAAAGLASVASFQRVVRR